MTLFDEKVGNATISTARSLRSIAESLERMTVAMEMLAEKLSVMNVDGENKENENETEETGS